MALSRRIARPLLASIFIAGGLDALRNPGGKVEAAEAVVSPISEGVPSIPDDPETLVRLNGAVQVVSGGLLAVGRAASASNTRRTASKAAMASKRQARKARRLGHLAQDRAVDALHHAATSDIPRQIGGAAASLATAAGATGVNVARDLKPAIEAAAVSGVDVAKPLLASGADVVGEVISNISDRLPSR